MTVLLILFTLITFLVVDFFMQRRRLGQTAKQVGALLPGCTNLPEGIALAENHTWLKRDAEGLITVGIDQFVGRLVGDLEEISLPAVDDHIAGSTPAFTLRHGSKTLSIAAPVIGRVVAVNRDVKRHPSLLRADAYGKGWLVKVKPYSGSESIQKLAGLDAAAWLKRQSENVRDFFVTLNSQAQLVTLQDGGTLADGLLQQFDNDVWQRFNLTFATLPTNGCAKEA